MNASDPEQVFLQEAQDLLELLEQTLLDLERTPGDGELIDTAFRALHTIKGSGAMFGFDRVAAFAHDFETAFDLIRKGKIDAHRDIVTVALSAKDYIQMLIEDADSADPVIGEAIVADLNRYLNVSPGSPTAKAAETVVPPDAAETEYRIHIA